MAKATKKTGENSDWVRTQVPISEIKTEGRLGSLQFRAAMSTDAVESYEEALRDDAEALPPIKLVKVEGEGEDDGYYLVDGFHTLKAEMRLAFVDADAKVKTGTLLDAYREAAGANPRHGVHRTNADKRNAVLRVASMPKLFDGRITQEKIALICNVTQAGVSKIIKQENQRKAALDPDIKMPEKDGKNVPDIEPGDGEVESTSASQMRKLLMVAIQAITTAHGLGSEIIEGAPKNWEKALEDLKGVDDILMGVLTAARKIT